MKTSARLIALSVLAALGLSTAVLAQIKGGEKLAGARIPVATTTAPVARMNCLSETRSVTDPSARGAFKKITLYTAHLCASCQNKEVTIGAGKLATRKVEHSCKTATVCCNVKN